MASNENEIKPEEKKIQNQSKINENEQKIINDENKNSNVNAEEQINNENKIIHVDSITEKLYPFESKQISQKNKNNQIKKISESNSLSIDEIRFLCKKSMEIFMEEPVFLELTAPIIICGDTHGQFRDLLRLFDFGGSPSKKKYLF